MKRSIEIPVGEATMTLVRLGLSENKMVRIILDEEIEPLDIVAERCTAYAEKSGMREEDMGEILGLTDKEFENIFGRAPQS